MIKRWECYEHTTDNSMGRYFFRRSALNRRIDLIHMARVLGFTSKVHDYRIRRIPNG